MVRSQFCGVSVAFVCAMFFASGCSEPDQHAPAQAPVKSTARPPASVSDTSTADQLRIADDLPPLPAGLNNAPRPPAVVRAVYEFAARHPEVLKYVPCFCGCERGGHKDNADCFVAGRDKAGKVTAWESHGMVCEICIDVGETAMRMHNSGASTAEIRQAVEQKYASMSQMNHTHTPTPLPPRGGGPHH